MLRAISAALALSITALAAGVLDVPFVPQIRQGCGSAAVAMLIEYWVKQTDSMERAAEDAEHIDRALPPGADGLAGSALKRYLDTHGFEAFIFDGEVQDLREHIAKGRPVIVCIAPRGPSREKHFAVVDGIEPESIVLNDPARGKDFREPLHAFLREWKSAGNWALLAVPRTAR
jgi:predicted double-glycine peptidase